MYYIIVYLMGVANECWDMYIQFTLTYALLTVTLLVYKYLVSEFVYLTQRDSIPKRSSSVFNAYC